MNSLADRPTRDICHRAGYRGHIRSLQRPCHIHRLENVTGLLDETQQNRDFIVGSPAPLNQPCGRRELTDADTSMRE